MGVLILFIVAAVLLYLGTRVPDQGRDVDTVHIDLPRELVGAKLVLCEPKSNLRTLKPFPIHGRPDEVYETNGTLVVLDTKVRSFSAARPEDVVKLSAYGAILRGTKKYSQYQVAPYGYLRIVNRETRKSTFIKVPLLSDMELIKVNERRLALYSGAPAKATNKKAFCLRCHQRSKCPARPYSG